jgi:aminoglycoside phosphotransferase (APT) family kinase protein
MNRMIFKRKITKTPLNKGWSNDQKFILSSSECKVLLRVLEKDKFDRKTKELNYLSTLDLGEVRFSEPFSVELAKDKVHYKTAYIEGTDLEEILDLLGVEEQRRLGHQAGRVLKEIHSQIKVNDDGSWDKRYSTKVDRKIETYEKSGFHFDHDRSLIEKLQNLKPYLKGRPICFQHGDYHIGNFLLCVDGNLAILDFDRWDIGDPWEEFNRIVWCREKSPLFASAMIDAYFDFEVPKDFFELLFLYVGSNAIGSIAWAQGYGDQEVEVMMRLIRQFDEDTDHFTQINPKWYASTK